jgi:superfamily II DNA/RNA helicase
MATDHAIFLQFLLPTSTGQQKKQIAAVDYYHALLQSMDCILLPDGNDDDATGKGIFGRNCPIYKLHGSVPHGERQQVLQKFIKGATGDGTGAATTASDKNKRRGSILLATDVAARGLNFPCTDWIVQFDPPGEVSDYVHRAGRVARAGRAGQSLLFLLPSERGFLDVLRQRGVKSITPFSLASMLNAAADICTALTQNGVARSGGGLVGVGRNNNNNKINSSSSRSGETFCCELQHRLEDCHAGRYSHQSSSRSKSTERTIP